MTRAIVRVVTGLSACAILAAPVAAKNKGATLLSGGVLEGATNDSIASRVVVFLMQGDCNLVAYQGSKPVWASNTAKKGTGCRAVMQTDGNLVVYRGDGKALWSSNTHHYPGGSLTAQPDGNVVIYQGGKARWATNTVIPPKKKPTGGASSPFPGCTFARTDTKCVIVTEWFKEVYQCGWNYGSMTPIEKSDGWSLSGACLGFDW